MLWVINIARLIIFNSPDFYWDEFDLDSPPSLEDDSSPSLDEDYLPSHDHDSSPSLDLGS